MWGGGGGGGGKCAAFPSIPPPWHRTFLLHKVVVNASWLCEFVSTPTDERRMLLRCRITCDGAANRCVEIARPFYHPSGSFCLEYQGGFSLSDVHILFIA